MVFFVIVVLVMVVEIGFVCLLWLDFFFVYCSFLFVGKIFVAVLFDNVDTILVFL